MHDGTQSGSRSSCAEIERAILYRIARGVYTPNQQLPTCEQLAAELGANKNTVSKTFRLLARRGYLRTVPGRGTFVLRRAAHADSSRALAGISSLLALAIQEAKLAGIGREQFEALARETAALCYGQARRRVAFVECSYLDAITVSRDLQFALAHPVEPLLLGDVMANPAHYLESFDLLALPPPHLAMVEETLQRVWWPGSAELFPLVVLPDADSLTQVAHLRSGTHLGIVCDLEGTLWMLDGLVGDCNPSIRTSGCLTGDEQALRKLLQEVDVILVTDSARSHLPPCEPRVPAIGVTLKPEERSMQQLAERLVAGASTSPPVPSGV